MTVDSLIAAGDPTAGESKVLSNLAKGLESEADTMDDVMNLAPLLRPSELEKISAKLLARGVNMTNIVELSRWLNDASAVEMIRSAKFDDMDGEDELEFLEHIIPLLDAESHKTLFCRVIDGELDWHILKPLAPYTRHLYPQIEAAYMEGVLPKEALDCYRIALYNHTWS